MSVRPDIVERLVQGATEGMSGATMTMDYVTSDEVVSAYFTLTRRAVTVSLQLTKNSQHTREALRQSLFTILADLSDNTVN